MASSRPLVYWLAGTMAHSEIPVVCPALVDEYAVFETVFQHKNARILQMPDLVFKGSSLCIVLAGACDDEPARTRDAGQFAQPIWRDVPFREDAAASCDVIACIGVIGERPVLIDIASDMSIDARLPGLFRHRLGEIKPVDQPEAEAFQLHAQEARSAAGVQD